MSTAAVFASLRSTDSFAWASIAGEWRDVSGDLAEFPVHEEAALLDAAMLARMFPGFPHCHHKASPPDRPLESLSSFQKQQNSHEYTSWDLRRSFPKLYLQLYIEAPFLLHDPI